jgi:hypothetical protein
MRPSAKVTRSRLALASGESSIFRAYPNSVSRTAWQAACTAEPAEAAVAEPPSTKASGSEESPILTVTSSIGSPKASAAICVRIV